MLARLLIFALFLPAHVHALDHLQKVKAKLLRWQTKNIVTINRGAEDGLVKNDHIKFISDKFGFVTRGIVVKTRLKTAYVRVYRKYHIQNLLKGENYTLLSIKRSMVPENIKEVAENISITLPKSEDPDNVDIKAELSEWVPASRKIRDKKTAFKTINQKQLEKDFEDTELKLLVAPINYSRIRKSRELSHQLAIENGDKGKFHGKVDYRYDSISMTDPYSQQATRYSTHNAEAEFGLNRIYNNWSYFARVTYERERFGPINPINYRFGLAPFNSKVHMDGALGLDTVSFSFGPLMHFQSLQGLDDNLETTTFNDQKLRALFELKFTKILREYLNIENNLRWMPSWGFPISTDLEDGLLTNRFAINFHQSILTVSYENFINWDSQRKSISRLPSTNLIHAFKFGINYKF